MSVDSSQNELECLCGSLILLFVLLTSQLLDLRVTDDGGNVHFINTGLSRPLIYDTESF